MLLNTQTTLHEQYAVQALFSSWQGLYNGGGSTGYIR